MTLTISGQDMFGPEQILGPEPPSPIPPDINDQEQPDQILDHRIRSRAHNHVFGPTVGMRATTKEFWRVTLGADTRFFIGINRTLNAVSTQQIYEVDEEPGREEETMTRFAPMMDLSLYARLRLTDHFRMQVGYELLFGAGFSRAFDNIRYNSVGTESDIGLDSRRSNFYAHGLTIGGEWLFR
jgi:hypothetical protein